MISMPGSLSFAKLVMMSSAPAKSAGDARYASQDPFIRWSIQSRLQSVLRVCSFYVERGEAPIFSWSFKPQEGLINLFIFIIRNTAFKAWKMKNDFAYI